MTPSPSFQGFFPRTLSNAARIHSCRALLAALALGSLAGATPARGAPKPMTAFPSSMFEIRIYSANEDGDIGVGNNTHLHLSAQIATVGLEPVIVHPHVKGERQWITDEEVIGAQASILRGFWESAKEFDQPKGRNSIVEVVAPGYTAGLSLTDEEHRLVRALRERTICDQIIIPIIIAVMNRPELKTQPKLRVLRRLVQESLAHNSKVVEDFEYELYQKGSLNNGLDVIFSFLWREVENGGLSSDLMIDGLRVSLKSGFAAWARRRAIANIHPYLKAADTIAQVLDLGPDAIQIVKTIDDMRSVPARLRFRAYFESGVDAIEPRFVHVGPIDQVFVLSGFQMYDEPGRGMWVTFSDRNGRETTTCQPDWILPNGSQAQVTVPNRYLRRATSPLTVTAHFGDQDHTVPNQVILSDQLDKPTLRPDTAGYDWPIEIHSPAINRYFLGNRVTFGARDGSQSTRARIERVADGYIVARVPNLSPTPPRGGWKVWFVSEGGGRKLESKKAEFTYLDQPWREVVADRRVDMMPESRRTATGTLSDEEPTAEILVPVPGGMQLVATLSKAFGPDADARPVVKSFGLVLEQLQHAELKQHVVAEPILDIHGPQPFMNLSHTTSGRLPINLYRVQLAYGSGGPINYAVDLEITRRDDATSGRDAPESVHGAPSIATGEMHTAHLFGEQRTFGEDLVDVFLVPNVQAAHTVRVSVPSVVAHPPGDRDIPAIRGIYLMHVPHAGTFELVASYAEAINHLSRPVDLIYEDARPGDYLLMFRNARGNAEYHFQVDVGFDFGPAPDRQPIKSLFDAGSDEAWKLGTLAEPPGPVHWTGKQGAGFVSSPDLFGTRKGPLDLVLVIDCTRSMSGLIDSVKQRSREIVARLRTVTQGLRVGIVFFSDIEANGITAAQRVVPLQADPDAALAAMQGWGTQDGGDDPEDMLHGIRGGLDLAWRGPAVGKAMLVITDNPAKLKDGKDGADNTLESIATLARERGVQIIPVPTQAEATLMGQSGFLARRTGGEVVPFGESGEIVSLLTNVATQAIERALPKYWIAPAKFRGDLSRFHGYTLAFRISGREMGRLITADDIILSGAGQDLVLRSALRPRDASFEHASWISVVVRLSSLGGWRVRSTGDMATDDDFRRVLADVSNLRIRAEYYAGEDSSALDAVVLGCQLAPTDRGLSPEGEKIAAQLNDAITTMTHRWRATYHPFCNAYDTEQWVWSQVEPAGVRRNGYIMTTHFKLVEPLHDNRGGGLEKWLHVDAVRDLYRWLEVLRQSGTLDKAGKDKLAAGIRAWTQRMQALDRLYPELQRLVREAVVANYRYQFAQPSDDPFALLERRNEAEDAVDKKAAEVAQLGGPVGLSPDQ